MERIRENEILAGNLEQVLAGTPLFAGVDPGDISAMLLCLQADFRRYEKNESVLTVGDSTVQIGVVLDGTVQICEDDYYGSRSILSVIGKGEMFGEGYACAGIEGIPVNVITQTDAVILFLNTDQIFHNRSFCSFHYILVENLLRIVAEKNVRMNRRLCNTMHKSIRERILAFLMDERRKHGSSTFEISLDRQELADYLGVDRSAMSSELSRMQKDGIIKVRKRAFELL